MSITLVSSITSEKDKLIESHKVGGAKCVLFTDTPRESNLWESRPAYDKFKDNRRNSRIHKILIHKYIDTEYSIWLDGNIELIKPPEELIERYLKDNDIFFFEHQTRDCLYDEAMTCAKSKLDDPEALIEQAKAYEDEGFAKHKGLYIGNFIIRRHTERVEAFNNAWWAEYCRYSVRDQVSLPYALDKVALRVNSKKEPWVLAPDNTFAQRGDAIRIYPHIILNPPTI